MMSSIDFSFLLDEVSQNLKDVSKINKILNAARKTKLIAGDSESYKAQVNSGDNTAAVLQQLYSDLEKEGKLGIDKLELLRNLLKGVKEWYLIDKVDNFVKERKDFTSLLAKIIDKLDKLDCLNKLISICADFIPKEDKEDIKDLSTLFNELEKNDRLGCEQLATLKTILKDIGENDLLDEVTEFEKRRKKEEAALRRRDQFADAVHRAETVIKAPAAGLYSTLKHVGEQLIGALKMFCNFKTISGITLTVGSGIILAKGSQASLGELKDAFKEAVLPAAAALLALSEGSLCFTVQAENTTALKELWERYKDGTLQRNLEEFLITDDIRQLAGGEEVILTVHIDEQEFNDACLSLIVADTQVLQEEHQKVSAKIRRRNSDPIEHVRSKENDAVLFYANLRQAENKFHQEKMESLKKENENLRAQLTEGSSLGGEPLPSTHAAVASSETEYSSRRPMELIQERPGLKRLGAAATSGYEYDVFQGREVGDLESPRKKRRRNSDSDLYCKVRDDETKETEKKQHFLEDQKYAFVQRYLENVHETHSITTETSDSGIKTQGAPSELGTEDIPATDGYQEFCVRRLSEMVRVKLSRRMGADRVAARHIYESFGITGADHIPSPLRAYHLFEMFPDTPVKLLRDVFEALELLDLVELLDEETIPFILARSLRSVLSLDEIRKLRNTDKRPTSYLSKATVLILARDEQDYDVRENSMFFKYINLNSTVTILKYRGTLTTREKLYMQEKREECRAQIKRLMDSVNQYNQRGTPETDIRVRQLTEELQHERRQLDRLEKTLKDEEETTGHATAVIEEWIQCQEHYSFFAVFVLPSTGDFQDLFVKLAREIPNVPKLIVSGQREEVVLPETLLVTYSSFRGLLVTKLLTGILKKRWRTQTLVSMMNEFKRAVLERYSFMHVAITDTLSSLLRFKREEELS